MGEDATQLQIQNGDYIVTIGQCNPRDEADAALKTLEDQYGGNTGLFVSVALSFSCYHSS